MRAALIALPQSGEADLPAIAGKSMAHRQLLFARETGCTSVIAHGAGASADGIVLRHAAERLGMKFQIIGNSHALAGIIADDDSLLVLQPGLLPESRAALDLLRAEGDRILVVSAGPGVSAGFERIDLDRAWAGALTISGCWLGKLAVLAEDAAPHGALLRIALQQQLPEERLPDNTLDEGTWSLVGSEDAARARASDWLRTHLGASFPGSTSRWLAKAAISGPGARLVDTPQARTGLLILSAILLGGAIIAGIYERPVLGFLLVMASVPVLEAFLALSQLLVAPFGKLKHLFLLRLIVDVGLLAVGVMSIDSLPHRNIFPALVLVLALYFLDRRNLAVWVEPLRDRMVIAAFIALMALLANTEIAIMLAGLLVLAANIVFTRR